MVKTSGQHFINNPQAFLQKSYEKSCQNQMWAQYVGSSISNIIAMSSIWTAKATGTSEEETTTTTTATTTTETTQTTNTEEPAETVVTETDEEIKAKITDYLNEVGITTDDVKMEAIIKKYKNIKEFASANNQDITEAKLKERIILFAKGLEYRQATVAETNFEIPGIKAAITAGSQEDYNNSLRAHAKSIIELYDENGDEALDRTEFFASQLQAAGKELNDDNAAGMEIIFNVLDMDNSGKLEENEVSALQWTISKRLDGTAKRTGADITAQEYQAVQNDIATLVSTVLTTGLSEQDQASVKQHLSNGETAVALTIILNNAELETDDRKQIETFLYMYSTGYQNFK